MLIRTSRLIPKAFDAVTVWPFIFIRPESAENRALIEHEKVHLREQARFGVLPWLALYLLWPGFRLAAEVRAYRRQIELKGISLEKAAKLLTMYRTGISYDKAVQLLNKNQ